MAAWTSDSERARGMGAAPAAGRVLRLGGAALSAALVVGLAVWAYHLAMRQLHGLPVIAAPEGPARTAPDNPGGELARHQGLAVNQIAAVGEAEASAEMLRLAPAPAGLTEEDTASDALRISGGTALAPPARTEPSARTVTPSETMKALSQSAPIAEPLPDEAAEPIFDPSEALIEAMAMLPPDQLVDPMEPGLAESPRPRARPEGDIIAAAAAEAVAAALAPEAALDVDPATLAPRTPVAQIGSYDTEAEAKLGWDAAVARFGALFDGKRRVIQAAENGGRTFFRLRVAGFESKDDARRFCAALKSGGQCVPATVR
jgi:hypothetical protein